MNQWNAIVLAGGRGKRMDMLCHVRAKPVLPFAGGFRVIDFTLSNCLNSGINDISVLIDYHRQSVKDYLEDSSFASRCGDRLRLLEPRNNGSYLGTADAVYQNRSIVEREKSEAVLVLAGDHIYRMDYTKLLAFHRLHDADVTVGVVSVPIAEANRFGIITADGDGKVTAFDEKPRLPTGNLASMGIYLFKPGVLKAELADDAARPHSAHDFGHNIIPSMVGRSRVYAYRFADYWQDIGTIESYLDANLELTRETPAFCLNGGWPITTARPNVLARETPQSGVARNSRISQGCVIEGLVENSILSPGVRVEKHAVVRNSVVMAGSVIGWHSVVDGCVVDENVRIGKSCYLGFGPAANPRDRGITVIGKGAEVPDFTAIDRNCRIGPYSAASDFKTIAVPTGTVMISR